jgi:hypothetical protein
MRLRDAELPGALVLRKLPLAASFAPERLIVVAGDLAYLLETIVFDRRDLDHQVVHDVPRELAELLLGEPGDLDPEDHRAQRVHLQGELFQAEHHEGSC